MNSIIEIMKPQLKKFIENNSIQYDGCFYMKESIYDIPHLMFGIPFEISLSEIFDDTYFFLYDKEIDYFSQTYFTPCFFLINDNCKINNVIQEYRIDNGENLLRYKKQFYIFDENYIFQR